MRALLHSVSIVALLGSSAAPACSKRAQSGNTTPPVSSTPVASPSGPVVKEEVLEDIFQGGLKNNWKDWGWAPRKIDGPGPAEVRFTNWGGWIIAKQGHKLENIGSLVFREKAPKGEAEFLEVRVESSTTTTFPRVRIRAEHHVGEADGWVDVRVPMAELNPDQIPFDRVILRAFRPIDDEPTLLDNIAFTKADASTVAARLNPASYASKARAMQMRVSCDAKAIKVNPLIYGIAYYTETDKSPAQWTIGATARRFGGNAATRYNWEGNFWNLDNDWFFENKPAPMPYLKFFEDNEAHGVASVLTVPIMGWVAKDGTSSSFPVSVFGPQERVDDWNKEAGNGKKKDGTNIKPGPPTRTSIEATPEFIKRWIEAIVERDKKLGKRSVRQYILDNEPMLWTNTHRDVRTEPLGYDELLDRTIKYGTVIRQADPDAVIAGPAEWGWTGFYYSGKDQAGNYLLRPDRRAHEDLPVVEWYLKKLAEHEQKTGVRVLDVLDLHHYPAAEGVYSQAADAKISALRLRMTRALWDPTYNPDESWIKEPVRLLPRMKEWVAKYYPGRGISIGEWNFGGEGHISGALATAEALGRFAQFGVTSAFYWTHPPEDSPSLQGFLAFRNFDGKGGHFLDWYVPSAPVVTADHASVFASRDESGKHLVAVAINMSPEEALMAKLDLEGCSPVASRASYTYLRGAKGFVPNPVRNTKDGTAAGEVLPPWSITVFDMTLAQPMPGAVER